MFGIRLKELRLDAKLTQKNLADALITTQSTIGKYERGVLEPSLSMLVSICRFFSCSADFLLGLED